ncbi:MAG: NAD(P)-dependent oxidoreductase [Candidatus Dormibacteraeota bacterium]|nr:NAD(P)-dependent oxidoreductase [Candidatus Dormibacteraeota bacterium]MBO0705013.1 NAD(P)-dependent oxidoreductase [Candidatus Dormibacteraeota bacterium]MBO0762409.1 NAD(P)-dependent oxidoreductase [Candidatus Dormibacteraeota bacterium]
MRVLVVGAGGAIGTHLVPQLRERGHEVIGSSRSSGNAARLRALGAEPIVVDALDAAGVREAVAEVRPDAIISETTALSDLSDFKHFDRSFAQTNRLRSEGTDILLAAAKQTGVRRLVFQSYANFRYARVGGAVKREEDPLEPNPPAAMREAVAAMDHLDRAVTEAGGIALRYGNFYGDPKNGLVSAVRARKFPIVGDGRGVWSHIHLDDAAAATVLALEHEGPAVYNIVDDDPAPTGVWLPELARIVGARPPQRFPRAVARVFAGEVPVMMATESRGASNERAKRELGWTLRYPSWRQGFVAAYGKPDLVRAA